MKIKGVKFYNGYLFYEDKTIPYAGDVLSVCLSEIEDHPEDAIVKRVANCYGCRKIIAQSTELSFEGIPYVELEEDVEMLAKNHSVGDNVWSKESFIVGYNTKQTKKYTEDDLRKAIYETMIEMNNRRIPEDDEAKIISDKIFQSLKPNIESIELETWVVHTDHAPNGFESGIETYEKDGKTFLKIKQINHG